MDLITQHIKDWYPAVAQSDELKECLAVGDWFDVTISGLWGCLCVYGGPSSFLWVIQPLEFDPAYQPSRWLRLNALPHYYALLMVGLPGTIHECFLPILMELTAPTYVKERVEARMNYFVARPDELVRFK